MGIDAKVKCKCFINGISTPPPINKDLIFIDKYGEINTYLDYDKYKDEVIKFDLWIEQGCDHEGMNYKFVHISDWTNFFSFLDKLMILNNFKTLKSVLPKSNGGLVKCELSNDILNELHNLNNIKNLDSLVILDINNNLFADYNSYNNGILFKNKDFIIGIDNIKNNLYIKNNNKIIFQGQRIKISNKENATEFVNIEDDTICLIEENMYKSLNKEDISYINVENTFFYNISDLYFEIKKIKLDMANFDNIIQNLINIFKASKEINNSVIWC